MAQAKWPTPVTSPQSAQTSQTKVQGQTTVDLPGFGRGGPSNTTVVHTLPGNKEPAPLNLDALRDWATTEVPPTLFLTVQGAHLYGFESAHSPVELRGCYLAPLRDLLGLREPPGAVDVSGVVNRVPVTAVAHEAGKYFALLAKHNSQVLEQVLAPQVVVGAEFLARLRPVAERFATRHCYPYYAGFLRAHRKALATEEPKQLKTLLTAYRVALTGLHLLRNGKLECHLATLNDIFKLSYVGDLLNRRRSGQTRELSDAEGEYHAKVLARLDDEMARESEANPATDDGPFEELEEFLLAERFAALDPDALRTPASGADAT